jgi:energy-coupling factor transport system permease protein
MWALMRLKSSSFHPYSWWALGLAFAISAAAASNVFALLGIIALVLAVTLGAREATRWARSLSFYLVTALAVVLIRVIFRIVFNFDSQTNTAFALPLVTVSLGELGRVELFGRVSWDALLGALRDGLRMAAIILSVGLANTLANPRRLLKNTPGALYEVASAWVIALNMAPQLIDSAKRVKQASRLRGRNQKQNVLGSLIIPVLEDTIERSLALAASMSARGFGRQGQLSQSQQIASRVLSLFGVICLSIGAYLLLTLPRPWVGALLLGAGVLAVLKTSRIASKRQIRTRYAPEPWAIRDFSVLGAAALIACLPLIGVF